MKSLIASPADLPASADAYARRVAARLALGSEDLPYDISERLRASRAQALARRKRPAATPALHRAPQVVGHGPALTLGGRGSDAPRWWQGLASAIPLMALVAGLVVVQMVQDEATIDEVAQVDAALLTDDLPPSAYADPGFVQFLKTSMPAR